MTGMARSVILAPYGMREIRKEQFSPVPWIISSPRNSASRSAVVMACDLRVPYSSIVLDMVDRSVSISINSSVSMSSPFEYRMSRYWFATVATCPAAPRHC